MRETRSVASSLARGKRIPATPRSHTASAKAPHAVDAAPPVQGAEKGNRHRPPGHLPPAPLTRRGEPLVADGRLCYHVGRRTPTARPLLSTSPSLSLPPPCQRGAPPTAHSSRLDLRGDSAEPVGSALMDAGQSGRQGGLTSAHPHWSCRTFSCSLFQKQEKSTCFLHADLGPLSTIALVPTRNASP